MSGRDTGGAAFPFAPYSDPRGDIQFGAEGMTLRDYFAAKAMEGDWACQGATGTFSNAGLQQILNDRAALFYRMADAMLKARSA